MKLSSKEIKTIIDTASAYNDLCVIVSNSEIEISHKGREIKIHELDLLNLQRGITGHVDVSLILLDKSKRNSRLENGELEDVIFVDTNHLKSNPEVRFSSDFETISHIKTKTRNSKTLLQDSTRNFVFTGDHFDYVINTLTESPVRYLKKNFPNLFECLLNIERKSIKTSGVKFD